MRQPVIEIMDRAGVEFLSAGQRGEGVRLTDPHA